ncbi:MAG: methyltransferase family protein [Candidatus Dadabacteria bacterium]
MALNHIFLASLWIAYCVIHSLLASISIKKKIQQKVGYRFKYYRLFYTIFSFVGLIALTWLQISLPSIRLVQSATLLRIIGVIISMSGIVLMLICIKKYFMSLSGFKTLIKEESSTELIITGVHRYVRHPLYLGTFIFLWGSLLIFPLLSWLIAVLIITIYTVWAIKFEEDKLLLEYGSQYKIYMEQVPKLIPWRRSLQ